MVIEWRSEPLAVCASAWPSQMTTAGSILAANCSRWPDLVAAHRAEFVELMEREDVLTALAAL